MNKTYKNCQSCFMPLKQDPQGGGSSVDNTKSKMYCSYCYEGGNFKQPDMEVGEMQAFVKNILKQKGFPGFLAGWMTKGIPNLERWKKANSTNG